MSNGAGSDEFESADDMEDPGHEEEPDAEAAPEAAPKKKVVRRKPLWLLIPAGERHIDTREGPMVEHLYVVQRCDGMAEVNKYIKRKQFDASNMPQGILLLRAEPKAPDVGTQLVVKW